ncbi:DUF6571 family protein [Streptomyces beijiangensis]|uniref:DUF6571 domain-containing protein n=1 Tax=Streptomyces beijiangensis TaxID=163361 RepID=A0A939JK80_9ACTN|nr:DUF6571 family protein [Streptomyces beijiangensis]MBO0515537.1 hypothetical protein [Streptomyces beijiangensis]
MVSFGYLNDANLVKLDAAARSWALLPAKYQGLEEQFTNRVINLLKGSWEGEAADAAQRTMQQAKEQYQAAAGEARRIGALLADAHTEFSRFQKQLHDAVEGARKDSFTVSDTGTVTDEDARWDSPTASAAPGFASERKDAQDAVVGRLNEILMQVTAADEACNTALNRDANGGDNHGFNTKGYTTLDDVEVDQAAALMKKDGRLSDAEFDKLRTLLKVNKNDPEFSRDFAKSVGAKGTLEKYNELLNPPAGTQLSKTEISELKEFQRDLGTTIGTATTSDDKRPDPGITKFQKDLLGLGNHEFNANPTQRSYGFSGYQVTSSLMGNGKWDKGFLQDYGDALITEEKTHSGATGGGPGDFWSSSSNRFLGSPHMGAIDPMAGFMDALGHNPDASTEFLGSSTSVDGKDVDHLDYLMKDRKWPQGADFTGDAKNPSGVNNLGHAMESATSGQPYDYEGDTMPKHTAEQANLVNSIVGNTGGEGGGKLLGGKDASLAPLSDSLGNITANYMGDFQRSLSEQGGLPVHGVPVGGESGIDRAEAVNFLSAVGQDPDAYQAITASQQAYTSVLVDGAVRGHPDDAAVQVGAAVHPGSEMAGIMSQSRAEAVYGAKTAEADDFNSNADMVGKWVGRGISSVTESIPIPIVGPLVDDVQESVLKSAQQDNADEATYSAGKEYVNGQKAAEIAARVAADRAAQNGNYNSDMVEDLKTAAGTSAKNAFTVGSAVEGARHG